MSNAITIRFASIDRENVSLALTLFVTYTNRGILLMSVFFFFKVKHVSHSTIMTFLVFILFLFPEGMSDL